MFQTDHWLSDERNVIQLHLQTPAWEEQVETPEGPTLVLSSAGFVWEKNLEQRFMVAGTLAQHLQQTIELKRESERETDREREGKRWKRRKER